MAKPLFLSNKEEQMLDHRFFLSHDYALINPLHVEASAYAQWRVVPLAPTELGDKPQLLPCLLNLRTMPEKARIEAMAHSEQWQRSNPGRVFFSALLASGADEERVARHLSNQLLIRNPRGGQAVFRWYDPSVFRHLPWLLDEEQLSGLLGPVQAWSWRVVPGPWQRHERGAASRLPWLRLLEPQWTSLTRLGVLNRGLAQLSRRLPGRDIAAQRVMRLLEQAYEVWELEEEQDCLLFVEQALRFDDGIHQHPELSRRLRAARAGELSYVGACVGLDMNQWRPAANSAAARPPQGDQENGNGMRSL